TAGRVALPERAGRGGVSQVLGGQRRLLATQGLSRRAQSLLGGGEVPARTPAAGQPAVHRRAPRRAGLGRAHAARRGRALQQHTLAVGAAGGAGARLRRGPARAACSLAKTPRRTATPARLGLGGDGVAVAAWHGGAGGRIERLAPAAPRL